MEEVAYLQRIVEVMAKEMDMDMRNAVKVMKAFDELKIFSKKRSEMMRATNRRTFELEKEVYKERMQWINDYMKVNGMNEDIFTQLDDFDISSDDYDYYYEFKTPTQYKKEEEARKAKKLGIKPAGEGREIDE